MGLTLKASLSLKKSVKKDHNAWPKIAILDLGVKLSILKLFLQHEIYFDIFSGDVIHSDWKGFDPQNLCRIFFI